MAGYSDYSKSNNAVDAEISGKYPISILAKKLHIKTDAIRAIMQPDEWHHTSCHYNRTNYYDGEYMIALASGDDLLDYDYDSLEDAAELLLKLRAWQAPKTETNTYHHCDVNWLQWSGSRNRPVCDEMTAKDVTVIDKGKAFIVICLPGRDMRKKKTTNGLKVTLNGKPLF